MNPDPARLIMALNHPLRRQILRRFKRDGVASSTQLSKSLRVSTSNVVYHVNILADLHILSLVSIGRVRGAKEHFYRSNFDDQEEWAKTALEASREKDEAILGDSWVPV
jgi:predicted transcriptional regulator